MLLDHSKNGLVFIERLLEIKVMMLDVRAYHLNQYIFLIEHNPGLTERIRTVTVIRIPFKLQEDY